MKLHDRLLCRELVGPLMIGLGSCVMMMTLQNLFSLFNGPSPPGHQPLQQVGHYLLLKLPTVVEWSLPVALLLGSSLALSRLQHETELTAIRIAGVSLLRFLAPLLLLSLALGFLSRFLGEVVVPPTDHQAEAIKREFEFQGEVAGLARHTFFRYGNRIFYFRNPTPAGPNRNQLQGIVVYQLGESAANSEAAVSQAPFGAALFWTAETGEVNGQVWTLWHPREYHLAPTGEIISSRDLPVLRFDLHRNIQFFLNNQQTPQELTAAQLAVRIQESERLSVPDSVVRVLRYELAFRMALPFACVVFVLVSAPLTLRWARGGSLLGILIAFGVLFFYYDLMVIAQKVSLSGLLSPEMAAWVPNAAFGAFGLAMVLRDA